MGLLGILLLIVGAAIQIGAVVYYIWAPSGSITVLQLVGMVAFGGLVEGGGILLFINAARQQPDDE